MCVDCSNRYHCQHPCPYLERLLKEVTRNADGRELSVNPHNIEWVWIHRAPLSLSDLMESAETPPSIDLSFMTRKQKTVFELHVYRRMSTRKIADAMNLSQSTVSQHLRYAKKKVRELLRNGGSLGIESEGSQAPVN